MKKKILIVNANYYKDISLGLLKSTKNLVLNKHLIKTIDGYLKKSYVGYTKDLNNRITKHNSNIGAKSICKQRFIKNINNIIDKCIIT